MFALTNSLIKPFSFTVVNKMLKNVENVRI